DALVAQRERERPEGSYTTTLFESGIRRMAQKVGEEGVETALAAVAQDDDALLGEAADLLYHLLVVLHARKLDLATVTQRLHERHKPEGGHCPPINVRCNGGHDGGQCPPYRCSGVHNASIPACGDAAIWNTLDQQPPRIIAH